MAEVQILNKYGEVYVPRPTQAAFHASAAPAKAYMGGMGCGKTTAAAIEGLLQSLEVPREQAHIGKALICRESWEELWSSTWKEFLNVIPYSILYQCRQKERPYPQIFFPNGFEVRGMNLNDPEKFGSEEYSWQWMDECGKQGLTEQHFLWMVGRRRNRVGRQQVLLTGHPAGRNWVWKYFFAYKEDATMKRYPYCEGFMASTEENVHLSPEYVEMMRQTYPEEWLTRYFKGDFGVAEGMILDSFNPDEHIVRPFAIPETWPRYRGIDHGLSHPTTCLWIAADFEGNLLCYREYMKRDSVPVSNVQNMLEASKAEEELVRWTVIDPATRARETAGGIIERVIDQYRAAGMPNLVEGDNDLPASITRLKALLYPDPEREFPHWHHYKGLPGSPRLFLMSTCPRLKWEIEQWQWMKLKPGQIDRQRVRAIDDDLIACLRYIVQRQPQEAVQPVVKSQGEIIEEMLAELAADRVKEDDVKAYIGAERVKR